jgi:hypothetical protein
VFEWLLQDLLERRGRGVEVSLGVHLGGVEAVVKPAQVPGNQPDTDLQILMRELGEVALYRGV